MELESFKKKMFVIELIILGLLAFHIVFLIIALSSPLNLGGTLMGLIADQTKTPLIVGVYILLDTVLVGLMIAAIAFPIRSYLKDEEKRTILLKPLRVGMLSLLLTFTRITFIAFAQQVIISLGSQQIALQSLLYDPTQSSIAGMLFFIIAMSIASGIIVCLVVMSGISLNELIEFRKIEESESSAAKKKK